MQSPLHQTSHDLDMQGGVQWIYAQKPHGYRALSATAYQLPLRPRIAPNGAGFLQ
jgi:hypothetical protein